MQFGKVAGRAEFAAPNDPNWKVNFLLHAKRTGETISVTGVANLIKVYAMGGMGAKAKVGQSRGAIDI